MKLKMRTLLLIPFFALLLVTSCQDEVIDITEPDESEVLVADSALTSFISSTSIKDGSADNIIDKASCLSVELPVTVVVNGLEIIVDSEEDFDVIETIFKEFDDDDDTLEMVFPITIILSDYTEIVLDNREDLQALIDECGDENEADEDIECIDFQYPISFSGYNADFQVIEVVEIENDRELYLFVKRIKNAEVFASLDFPVTMLLADGSTVIVNNNEELESTIREAKDACDEDDDNDYGDDDFTKERLDEYLQICPWVVHEFERNEDNLIEQYSEYAFVFKEDNVVNVKARNGDILTGTWTTRVTDNGALIKLEFDTLVDFTLEWFVYDIEYGTIKLYQAGGNKIILKKNCDVVIDITKERIESYLQECLWRIERLSVDGLDFEKIYIGTPLEFYENNIVKIRVNGELVEGTYEIGVRNAGFILQMTFEGRQYLELEWLITFLEPGLIKLENVDNQMTLMRHCPEGDEDINYINSTLTAGNQWKVTSYIDEDVNKTEVYSGYTIMFLDNGYVDVFAPGGGGLNFIGGSWLAYRNEGLFLGLQFEDKGQLDPFAPFYLLNHRWQIKEISQGSIELKDYNANGEIERQLVLEHIEF